MSLITKKSGLLLLMYGLLLLPCSLQAQNMEALQPRIQKKKYKQCKALTVFIDKETGNESEAYLSRLWIFNSTGQIAEYKRYNAKKELEVKGVTSYNKNGKIKLTEEENRHIDEHEKLIYSYTSKGNLDSKTDYRDGKLLVTYKHYYNGQGLRDSTIWLDKNNSPELVEYYTYNAQGQLVELRENSLGRSDGKTIFEYHNDGTLKDQILYDGFGNIFERMFYNEDGLIVKRAISYIDYSVSYEYSYKKGLLRSMTKTFSNKVSYEYTEFEWSKKVD